MDTTLSNVKAFHDAFEIESPEQPTLPGHTDKVAEWLDGFATRMEQLGEDLHKAAEINGKNVLLLRLQLIQEELGELARAIANKDLTETFDALVDLRYVLDGTTIALGMGGIFMDGFFEVQRSNMSKLENGKPLKNEAGRVVKGANYTPPDMQKFLINPLEQGE